MPGEVKDPTQGNGKKPVVESVSVKVELVILISKLTKLSHSLAVISCKGSISSSIIKHVFRADQLQISYDQLQISLSR